MCSETQIPDSGMMDTQRGPGETCCLLGGWLGVEIARESGVIPAGIATLLYYYYDFSTILLKEEPQEAQF